VSGNRPFGGRSSICPEAVFDDGKPDGMIVGRENGRTLVARFGQPWKPKGCVHGLSHLPYNAFITQRKLPFGKYDLLCDSG
jgi:hypothetical protein